MTPADQKVSASRTRPSPQRSRASVPPAKLAMYTGLPLRTVQRLESGEEWLKWMRLDEGTRRGGPGAPLDG